MDLAQRCNFEIGDYVDSRYRIERILGEGTFGIVYSVLDNEGERYALKLLRLWEVHPEIRNPLLKRFDMEFDTGRIDSNYLVHSLGHGYAMGNPYILMEYCDGGDLISIAMKEELNLFDVATCVLYGLRDLHQRGKVHRDLKPENVLRKHDGTYALTDFGISGDRNKRMTERNILGKPKQIFGTYAYMPPEQSNPRKDATVLPTTDIYSFGVMMYQLITGELPFGKLEGESDLVRYLKHGKNGEWNKKRLLHIDGGKEWEELIEGCLYPDFHKRLQTVEDVLRLVPQSSNSSKTDLPRLDYKTKIVKGILLRVMQGDDYGKVYYLDDMLGDKKSILTLGRKEWFTSNDIEISEEGCSYISRNHCTFELDYDFGCWVVRDGQWNPNGSGGWKRSTNGTYVNSTEVTASGFCFFPGDIISVGDTKLRAEAY
jgi:serine/threonine protein kinase